ncbi:MAG: anti-sigma factor family protein [Anaerolineae bacterium]
MTDEERADELFSPYIDGQVTAEERTFLERYLADHPESRAKFEMLKAAVQLTKKLPLVKAPRSFVLPRSMARKPSFALRLYPVMRFATVAATMLFVFALAGDLATTSRFAASPESQSVLSLAQATAAATATQEPEVPLAEAPAPAATEAVTAQSQAVTITETLPAPTPPAAAADAAATEGSVTDGTPAARAAAPTEAPLEEEALTTRDDQDRLTRKSAEAPASAQIDVLRIAVIVLAGLAVILAATTLVLRRRAR